MNSIIAGMRILLAGMALVGCVAVQGVAVSTPLDPALADRLTQLKEVRSADLPGLPETLFRTLDLSQLLAVRDLLLADAPSPRREELLRQVFYFWGRRDGPAAFAYADEQQTISRYDALGGSLVGWVTHDPDSAWDVAMARSNRGADRRYPIMAMLTVVGEQDLGHALRLYEDLLPDKACVECAAAHLMVAASRNGDFDRVLAAARGMEAGPLRAALWGQYWGYMGQYMPEWGLRRLGGVTDAADRKLALTEFCKGWGQGRFDDCLEYILYQADSDQRDDLILAVVQDWSHQATHGEVVRVLKTLPADLSDRAMLGLAASLANLDARAVVDWVRPRPYSQTRTTALDRAMWRWATLDAEAAHAYLVAVEDRETRGILIWSYLRAKVRNGTFVLTELAEIDAGYSGDWRERLFAQLATDLANPTVNSSGRYDLKEYIKAINERSDLSAEAKQRILTPFAQR